MAQPLRNEDFSEVYGGESEQEIPAGGDSVEKVKRELRVIQSRITDASQEAKERAIGFYGNLARTFRNLTSSAARQARRAREERPVQFLAVIAGTALFAGIAARIWRGRHE